MSKRCIIYYDGASKGNPGQSGGGAVIHHRYDDSTSTSIRIRVRVGLGHRTNNEAEYEALKKGLEVARDHGYEDVIVRGDSELVHRQVIGWYRVRNPNLRALLEDVATLIDGFRSFRSQHVRREKNRAADFQANLGCELGVGEVEIEVLY